MGLGHVKEMMEHEAWTSATNRYVAICASYHADRKGVIRMSQVELAGEMVISVKTLARTLDALCEDGTLVRLGHGRYGIRYELNNGAENEQRPVPQPKGQEAEAQRLQAIVAAERAEGNQVHGIAYRRDGWPVLVDLKDYRY